MEKISFFIDFGGYGQFIWAAYGLSALVLIAVLVQSLRFKARTDAELANLQDPTAASDESSNHETKK